MLRAGPTCLLMYFRRIKFPQFFSGVFKRKSTHKLFSRLDELVVHMHHEFVPGKYCPRFDISCDFHFGTSSFEQFLATWWTLFLEFFP